MQILQIIASVLILLVLVVLRNEYNKPKINVSNEIWYLFIMHYYDGSIDTIMINNTDKYKAFPLIKSDRVKETKVEYGTFEEIQNKRDIKVNFSLL